MSFILLILNHSVSHRHKLSDFGRLIEEEKNFKAINFHKDNNFYIICTIYLSSFKQISADEIRFTISETSLFTNIISLRRARCSNRCE